MDRRDFLTYGSLSTLATFQAGALLVNKDSHDNKERVLHIAHITDVHLSDNPDDEHSAPRGLEQCLHHLQGQADPPDIIFNGGDSINDALGASRSSVERQWELWHSIMKQENSLPVVNSIGNHDVWGEGDPLCGKQWTIEAMQLDRHYYSFDQIGFYCVR